MKPIRGMPIIRSAAPASATVRANTEASGDGDTLVLEFSRFNTWYEIDSVWEGRFLERTAPGAFKRTIGRKGPEGVKVLFNHGMDVLGDQVLGVPSLLEERETSPYMEVPLLRGVPELIVEGLRAGAYGSSFMFEVVADEWNYDPERSEHNPDGIPERTIREVNLFEAGPVTWPANPEATAGLRSGSDWYLERMASRDPERYADLTRAFKAFRAAHDLGPAAKAPAASKASEESPVAPAPDEQSARPVDGISAATRKRRLFLIDME